MEPLGMLSVDAAFSERSTAITARKTLKPEEDPMRRRAIVGVLLMLMPVGVRGDAPPVAVDPVVAELAKLNSALLDLVGLMRKQGQAQDLDLLMKRVQLSDARLGDSQRALKSAESERRSLEDERSQLEMAQGMIESRMAQMEQAGENVALVEAEATQTENRLKKISQRIGMLAGEIGSLENEVASRREEVRSWHSALDRRLSAH